MRVATLIPRVGLSLSILSLVSCSSPQPTIDPTATAAIATGTPAPLSTAPPALRVLVSELVPATTAGDWFVIGKIENRGPSGLSEITLQVSAMDADGQPVASASTSPVLANLVPGEVSPFIARLLDAPAAVDVSVSVQGSQFIEVERAALQIELGEQFITERGELAVLGRISNHESQPVTLAGIGLLAESSDSRPRALAEMQMGPGFLASGEQAPFLALTGTDPAGGRWQIFHDGSVGASNASAGLVVSEGPQLHFDPQGAPFVLGSLQNQGTEPLGGSILLIIRAADRVLSLGELRLPIGLQPNARAAFGAIEFPGLALRAGDLDPSSLSVEARVESWLDGTEPVLLSADVDTFHSVGSKLFVGGNVHNPLDTRVQDVLVLGEIRSTDGELLSAGWMELEHALDPQQSGSFVLELPLTAGLEIPLTELDLRVMGTTAQP